MSAKPVRVLQANVRQCQKAHHECVRHFLSNDFSIALISEPYVGRGPEVHFIAGVDIYQFSTSGSTIPGRIKACILIKQSFGSALGLTQDSSPNLAVVQIMAEQRRIIVASIYIEPDVDASDTGSKLNRLFLNHPGASFIVGGDVNAGHQDWGCLEADDRGNELVDIAAASQISVCNTGSKPTFEVVRGGVHLSSIVDVTFASDSIYHLVTDWQVDETVCVASDHHAITFSLNVQNMNSKRVRTSTYLFNNKVADWERFDASIREEVRSSGLLEADLASMDAVFLDEFVESMTDAIREACFKSMPLRGFAKPYNPWWSDALERHKQNCIRIHHRLSCKKSRNLDIVNELRDYSGAKKAYASAIRKASTKNFREFCTKQTKEDVWSLTSRLIKDAPTQRPPSTLKIGSGFTASAQQTANALTGKFYPDDNADASAHHRELRNRTSELPASTEEPDFTTDEIIDCLKSMNPNRAPGRDNLTSDICLRFTNCFPNLITRLMNRCLSLGHFPSYWKLAIVKILPKPGKDDYADLASFRPIGLLPIFGKLLEKLFVRRLTYDARKRGVWSRKQYGFREQSSTVDALSNAIAKIKEAKGLKQQVVAVSLDIKAAFDNAWWPSIFERLRRTQCPINIFRLIQSYFIGRAVSLTYGDAECTKAMTRGCVQGSVCGPTFWNLVLDELLELPLPEGCHIQAFADDVLLLVRGKDTSCVQEAVNRALQIIGDWGDSVKLAFSPTKTQAVPFTPDATQVNIAMNGVQVPFSDSFKLLGVIIDKNLRFADHVRSVVRKASNIFKNLCKFVRPTWGVHSENVSIIYRQVIEPIITYAAEVWGSVVKYEYVRRHLRSFQRTFAIRAIRGFHTISAVSALALARFTPLHLKIKEVHDIGRVKRTGVSPDIPDDVRLESRARPEELLHPSKRRLIPLHTANNQVEADALASATNIYTDGSKSDAGVGAAFVVKHNGSNLLKKFKLNSLCSVFQAELLALSQALRWCVQHLESDATVFSDSLSGLNALSHPSNTNQLVNECRKHLEDIRFHIKFVWVKAHVGITGNEEADVAAKAASTSHNASAYNAFPLSLAKRIIRSNNYEEWAEEYRRATTGSGTKFWLPTLPDVHRAMEVMEASFQLTQILTGHGFHKEYLHRFKITPDALCPCDGRTIQSLDHLIKDCNRFASERLGYRTQCTLIRAREYDISTTDADALNLFQEYATSIIDQLKAFNG